MWYLIQHPEAKARVLNPYFTLWVKMPYKLPKIFRAKYSIDSKPKRRISSQIWSRKEA